MRIPIVFSDDHLLVIDKPADLLTVPDRFDDEKPFVFGVLRDRYPELLPVHRLDRQTSGLLAIARTKEAHRALNDHFSNRRVAKDYLALVDGTPHPAKGTIDQPIANSPEKPGKMMVTQRDGKPAQTDYEVLESFKDFSWLSVRIHTGRTHQIRVHLAYLGHPLAVDELVRSPLVLYALRVEGPPQVPPESRQNGTPPAGSRQPARGPPGLPPPHYR